MRIISPLYNKKIYSANKMKKLGWVRAYVFIPHEGEEEITKEQIKNNEHVGLLIKRPDLLWMFHRSPGYIFKDDVEQNKNKIHTVPNKASVHTATQKIPNTNIKWRDAVCVPLRSQKEIAAKEALKQSPKVIKQGAKVAGHVAADNLEAHSSSLKNMFSEFKKEYKKGREEGDD